MTNAIEMPSLRIVRKFDVATGSRIRYIHEAGVDARVGGRIRRPLTLTYESAVVGQSFVEKKKQYIRRLAST